MYILGALSGGLWIIPIGFLLASIWSFFRAFLQWKSGSGWWGKDERGVDKWFESEERVPFFSIGAAWFGIILFALSVGSFIWMQLEK